MRRLARFVTRKWPEPVYELRRELGLPPGKNPIFDAKHSPNLVLALFSRVLGTEQKDWPANTLITGFCFYDADAGNAALPAQLNEFLAAGEPPVVFTQVWAQPPLLVRHSLMSTQAVAPVPV